MNKIDAFGHTISIVVPAVPRKLHQPARIFLIAPADHLSTGYIEDFEVNLRRVFERQRQGDFVPKGVRKRPKYRTAPQQLDFDMRHHTVIDMNLNDFRFIPFGFDLERVIAGSEHPEMGACARIGKSVKRIDVKCVDFEDSDFGLKRGSGLGVGYNDADTGVQDVVEQPEDPFLIVFDDDRHFVGRDLDAP